MLEIAITLFLVSNPIGNAPAVLALLKGFDFEKQKKILLRESFFALLIALFFQYFGELFLRMLHVEKYTTLLTGGIILLIVAFDMIFPSNDAAASKSPRREPFIVPIATPLLSGSGLLSVIMLFAARENNPLKMTGAILITWVVITFIMYSAPYLNKLFKKRGLIALEQFMGMILVLISMEMLVKGGKLFLMSL